MPKTKKRTIKENCCPHCEHDLTGLIALDPVRRLSRDLANAAAVLSDREARYLVSTYYIMQEQRKRTSNQLSKLEQADKVGSVIEWAVIQSQTLEDQMRRALTKYADADPIGQWAQTIRGIGPVISAGLSAHIDITQCPTVGHIWSFAGLNPSAKWLSRDDAGELLADVRGSLAIEKGDLRAQAVAACERLGRSHETVLRDATHNFKTGEPKELTPKSLEAALARRPWNAQLKTLCWKIGESFVKVSGYDDDIYGSVYIRRKAYETAKNEKGEYSEIAFEMAKKFGRSTDAYESYSQGKLPPGHLHARAKRYAVKLFLSHWHDRAYREHYKKAPPLPYPIAVMGHTHYIEAPGLADPSDEAA